MQHKQKVQAYANTTVRVAPLSFHQSHLTRIHYLCLVLYLTQFLFVITPSTSPPHNLTYHIIQIIFYSILFVQSNTLFLLQISFFSPHYLLMVSTSIHLLLQFHEFSNLCNWCPRKLHTLGLFHFLNFIS